MKNNFHILLEYDRNARREYFRNKALGIKTDDENTSPDDKFSVSCKEQINPITKKSVQNIYLHNISPEDMDAIREKMNRNTQLFTQAVSIPKGRNIDNTLVISVNDENISSWINDGGLGELQKILSQSGKYSTDSINALGGIIRNRLTGREETQELFNTAKNNAIDTWLQYIEKINDPETQELLKSYARIFNNVGEGSFGHVLSIKNVAMIRAVDSNATFVLPESVWLKLNRYVVPRAKKFIVYTPNNQNNKIDSVKLQKIIDTVSRSKNLSYTDLPIQMQIEVDIKCNQVGMSSFRPVIEFDVSDTRVIPGRKDLFNEEPGLANNLTGELNTKAKEDSITNNVDTGRTEDTVMEKRTKLAADFMENFCKDKGINVSFTANVKPSTILTTCLYKYYLSRAEKDANLDKDTNKDIFAKNATHFTLIFTKLAWEQLGSFSHSVTYTKKEGAEFLNMVNSLLRQLEPATTLNEELGLNYSREDLLKSFNNYCEENNIKII